MSDRTGQVLGKYQLVELLGQGGMAEVYRAFQPGLDRYVAVKVLHPHLAEAGGFADRFRSEARAVANLHHPHIVQVFDFDIQGEVHYMAMELVDGPTLKARLDELYFQGQRLPTAEVFQIFRGLCAAVGYAHSLGMIHRDIKPSNVMLDRVGRPVLTDFGIAKILAGSRYTLTGSVTGTPAYMSPEQSKGMPGDERSDLYALGVVLYECLTGRVPFDADTPVAVLLKHISDPVPLLRAARADLPEPIERVVVRALAKNPDERFQSAEEMWRGLEAAQREATAETLPAAPEPGPAPAARPKPRRPGAPPAAPGRVARLAAIVVAALMLGVAGFFALRGFFPGDGLPPAAATAAALATQGLPFDAAEAYSPALTARPNSVELLLARARAWADAGDPEQALADSQAAIHADPSDPRGHLALARYSLIFESDPDWIAVQAGIARGLDLSQQAGAEVQAEAYYTRGWATLYFQPETGTIQSLWTLGCLPDLARAMQTSSAAMSLVDLQKAVVLSPDPAEYKVALADALFGTRAYDESAAQLEVALDAVPDDVSILYRLALIDFIQADYKSAHDRLTELLSASPTSDRRPVWLAWRALASYERSDYSSALADLEESLRLAPDNPTALYVRALVKQYAGDPEQALADFDQLEAVPAYEYDCPFLSPQLEFELHFDRGLLHWERGQTAEALADLSRSIERHPGWHFPYYYRGLIYAELGDVDSARADLQAALSLAPDDNAQTLAQQALDGLK